MLVLARDIHRKKKKRNLSINDPKLTITITYPWLLQSWPNLGQQPSPSSPFFSPQPGHRPPIRVCDKYVNKSFLFSIHTGRKKTLQLRLPPCYPSFLQFPCCQAFQLSAPYFAVLSDKKSSCDLIMGCRSQYSRIIPTQYNYFFLLPDKPIFDSLHFCFFPLALHLISLNTVCAEKNHWSWLLHYELLALVCKLPPAGSERRRTVPSRRPPYEASWAPLQKRRRAWSVYSN